MIICIIEFCSFIQTKSAKIVIESEFATLIGESSYYTRPANICHRYPLNNPNRRFCTLFSLKFLYLSNLNSIYLLKMVTLTLTSLETLKITFSSILKHLLLLQFAIQGLIYSKFDFIFDKSFYFSLLIHFGFPLYCFVLANYKIFLLGYLFFQDWVYGY